MIRENFMSLVSLSSHGGGCWHWRGSVGSRGPKFMMLDVVYHAAQVSFWLQNGRLDPVVNECGNSLCVNPAHYSIMSSSHE